MNVLVNRPDCNPFYVLQKFRHLRVITAIESLNGEIRDIFEESSVYPADKDALLGIVRQTKPELASVVADIPFVYRASSESYLLYWTSGRPTDARSAFLVHDGDYFFTVQEFVERRMIPAYQSRATTETPASVPGMTK